MKRHTEKYLATLCRKNKTTKQHYRFVQTALRHKMDAVQPQKPRFSMFRGLGNPRSRCQQIQHIVRVHFLIYG